MPSAGLYMLKEGMHGKISELCWFQDFRYVNSAWSNRDLCQQSNPCLFRSASFQAKCGSQRRASQMSQKAWNIWPTHDRSGSILWDVSMHVTGENFRKTMLMWTKIHKALSCLWWMSFVFPKAEAPAQISTFSCYLTQLDSVESNFVPAVLFQHL